MCKLININTGCYVKRLQNQLIKIFNWDTFRRMEQNKLREKVFRGDTKFLRISVLTIYFNIDFEEVAYLKGCLIEETQ